jgi:hypothetical protein
MLLAQPKAAILPAGRDQIPNGHVGWFHPPVLFKVKSRFDF